MNDGVQLKYGQIRGGEQGSSVTVRSGQYIAAASGKFVAKTSATSGPVTLATLGNSYVVGHLEIQACNSTDGTEVVKVVTDPTAIFRIPVVAGTYAVTMIGSKCPLKIVSNIQGACLDSNGNELIIVDGDADNNAWVDVMLNPGRPFYGVLS